MLLEQLCSGVGAKKGSVDLTLFEEGHIGHCTLYVLRTIEMSRDISMYKRKSVYAMG